MNKSRAEWRAFISRIPLQFYNLEKVPAITTEISSMLQSYPKVFLGREAPYCYLSRIENSYAELTLGCNLKHLVIFLRTNVYTPFLHNISFLNSMQFKPFYYLNKVLAKGF